MNASPRLQHHPLLRILVKVGRRDAPPLVALRNTVAIVLPLAIGCVTGHLDAALAISVGALNTMFADQSGPYRLRFQHMLLTAGGAGLAAFAGAVLAPWPLALLSAVLVWGFATGMLVAISPQATRAGVVSLVVLLVMSGRPESAVQPLTTALLIFGGGVWQTLLAIAAWPLNRYRPERLASAQALRALASAARRPSDSGRPVPLPPSLNDLQSTLFGDETARGPAIDAFRVLVDLAERMRIELHALADLQTSCAAAPLSDALQTVRSTAAEVLDGLAGALERATPPNTEAALAEYAAAAARVEQHAARPGSDAALAAFAVARVAALGGQLRAAARNVDCAGSRGEMRAQRAVLRLPRALRPAAPIATLRANFRWSAPAFRHAVRLGACAAVGLGVSSLLPFAYGYWLPMTAAIVLRVNFGATWQFGLLRAAGTLGGLVFTTAILHFLPGGFWPALALMAVLSFAFRELATVHYGIAMVFLTGLVVILLSFYGVPADAALNARVIHALLGGALALIAYLAWPTWERGRERAALARVLSVYGKYLGAVLQGDADACRDARVAARAARSNAEASIERLRTEPAGRINVPPAEAMMAQANRIVRAAMVLEAAREDEGVPQLPGTGAKFLQACTAALDEAAGGFHEHRAPAKRFGLRDAQRDLGESLRGKSDPFSVALVDASDRIVDAIDSVLHVLTNHEPSPIAQPSSPRHRGSAQRG